MCLFLAWPITGAPQPHHATQRLTKRTFPIFSDFADGDPDQAYLEAAIPDAIAMARLAQDQTTWQSIYNKYFPSGVQAQVSQVFKNIVPDPSNPGTGSDALANCRIIGEDIAADSPQGSPCENRGTWGYTYRVVPPGLFPDVSAQSSVTYFCGEAYSFPIQAGDITCDSLGPTLSAGMEFLGATILHEWMHNDAIGAAATGNNIIDYNGPAGYGPYSTRQLLVDAPAACITNADSFAWLALEIYWSSTCNTTYQDPAEPSAITCYHAADPDGGEGFCPSISDVGWCDCGYDGLFPEIPDGQPAAPCGYTVAPDIAGGTWSPPSSNCGWYPTASVAPTCGPYDVSSDDAAVMASNLTSYADAGTICCSDGSGGCVNVIDTDGVALDLCSTSLTPQCMDCGSLAAYTTNLASACQSGGMVGGTQAIAEVPGLYLAV